MNLSKSFSGNINKGFTLIELLVVVAIIGVLSAIALASLNSARSKGSDSAVKSNLANIRSQAEILFNDYGAYAVDSSPTYFTLAQCANTADTLFSNVTIWGQISAAAIAGGGIANTRCVSSAAGWAVAAQLKTGGVAADAIPDSWCVDASGNSRAYTWTGVQTIVNSITGVTCS